jgi:hypothetical protein
MAAKLIFLLFFILAVGVITFLKFAAQGVKAGYDHVQDKDQQREAALQKKHLLGIPAPSSVTTQQRRALLRQCEAHLREHGHGVKSLGEFGADAEICGAIAGLFARLANGKSISLSHSYSSADLAVMWVGAVATDMATQAAGADFELSGMVMPASLADFDGVNHDNAEMVGGQLADMSAAAFSLHNRLTTVKDAQRMAGTIAECFMNWMQSGEEEYLLTIRRMLPHMAAHIAATTATATPEHHVAGSIA